MKVRFSLRSLLMLPLLFAVAWMWTTWPHRTFESFANALRDERFELAKSMVDSTECSFDLGPTGLRMKSPAMFMRSKSPSKFVEILVRQDRRLLDMLCARSVYRVTRARVSIRPWPPGNPHFKFVVERGKITLNCR